MEQQSWHVPEQHSGQAAYLCTMPLLCSASTALVMLKKLYFTLSPPSSQPPPSASQSYTDGNVGQISDSGFFLALLFVLVCNALVSLESFGFDLQRVHSRHPGLRDNSLTAGVAAGLPVATFISGMLGMQRLPVCMLLLKLQS